jgi:hypothetical protein
MAITKIQSESLNLADNYDFTGTVTGAGESNTPVFNATLSARQTGIPANTNTKINFDQTTVNVGSCYNTTTYKFTPNVAGIYFFQATFGIPTATDWDNNQAQIYKNGSSIVRSSNFQTSNSSSKAFAIDTANGTTDYYEMYIYWSGSGNQEVDNANGRTYFQGFLISTT